MKLCYHKGNNFGDALNPLIFKKLLPDFFNDETDEVFLGIGSILGLQKPQKETEKCIVFSSGFGSNDASTYGSLPAKEQLKKYDFRCVRGPLTANLLGLPRVKSICDGAILIPEVYQPNFKEKKFAYSYMPHVGSLKYYSGWKDLMQALGVNFIDPTHDVETVLEEINCTEILLTEAMHGAIVADTLRVPWIPIKTKKTINDFKWQDFCLSLNLEYQPHTLKTLYDFDFLKKIVQNKSGGKISFVDNLLTKTYLSYQDIYLEKEVIKNIKVIKSKKPMLSDYIVLKSKQDQLLESLEKVHQDYLSK